MSDLPWNWSMHSSLLTLSSDLWAGSSDVSDEGSSFAEEMHLI